jgi:hypothetical protein
MYLPNEIAKHGFRDFKIGNDTILQAEIVGLMVFRISYLFLIYLLLLDIAFSFDWQYKSLILMD